MGLVPVAVFLCAFSGPIPSSPCVLRLGARARMQLPLPITEFSLADSVAETPPPSRRIFCNRSLRLDQVHVVGFDMDYTLALYHQAEMDRQSIEATVKKLVERGYPESLLTMKYRTDFPVRGLLIDKKYGNVLKMDRYRYVKKAYHGMRELTREERRELYQTQPRRVGSSRYHWVDTLYALSEVTMFAAVIDEMERAGHVCDYDKLFVDIRTCIDLSHQDGSILDHVMADPARFVQRDPALGHTLHKLRSAGKRLFLLTNSRAAYTDRMMGYLLGDSLPEYPSWRNYFDVIVTAASKPRFFTEENPFLELLEDGTAPKATSFERGHIYTGGNIAEFERLIGAGGDRVLYVGDHIYGDVLRAKKESAWRTAMIIQEMDVELAALHGCGEDLARMDAIDDLRDTLYDELRYRQARFKDVVRALESSNGKHLEDGARTELEAARLREKRAVDRIRARLRAVEVEYDGIEGRVDTAFHPFWGSIFKSGPETTTFGYQVEHYACLYTSRVSNFEMYSPMYYFRSPRDRMPHE